MTETTWDGLPIAADWPRGATVVVFRRGSSGLELLLLHRAHHGLDFEGDWAWTPPCGARLPDEPVAECAARELAEEAGLTLDLHPLAASGVEWARYLAEAPVDAKVVLHDVEHDRFVWVCPDEALRRVAPQRSREAVRLALDTIHP